MRIKNVGTNNEGYFNHFGKIVENVFVLLLNVYVLGGMQDPRS